MKKLMSSPSKRNVSGFQFDGSWVFLSLFLFWAGAFELGPTQYPGQGIFFDGMIGVVIILLYFFSVLLHEGGHKLVALLLGRFYDGHQLTIWGGLPREAESFLPTRSGNMILRMGGPLSNLLAALLFHVGYSHLSAHPEGMFGGFAPFLFFGMQANFFLALVNLIPVVPMDMGALILQERVRKNPKGFPVWPFQSGLLLSWAMILFGLILASRGLLLSGFGLLFWGIHLARATLVWKGRMGLVQYLLDVDLREYVDKKPCSLFADQSVGQAFRKSFFPSGDKFLPVCDQDGAYLGFVEWRELKKVPVFLWEDRTVGSLELSVYPGRMLDLGKEGWKQVYDAIGKDIRLLYVVEDLKFVGNFYPEKLLERFRMKTEMGVPPEVPTEVKKKEDPEDPLTIPHESP